MNQLTSDKANQIIVAALAYSKTEGYPPMGVAVVDAAGQIKAFVREDGATALRFDIAMGKAVAAAGMSCSSRCLLYTSPSPRDQRGSRMPSSA